MLTREEGSVVAVEQAVEISAEARLAEILSFLNPPQQDYEKLADRAGSFLEAAAPESSVLRALAAYCDLFGRGYALWQLTYDYPRIHEYIYGAYLQARREGGAALAPAAAEALRRLSEAIIAYTWCENALIANDPAGLFQRANDAIGHATAGLALLPQAALPEALAAPLREYLEFNLALFRGLHCCAKGYLAARDFSDLAPEDHQTIEDCLATLRAKSYELYSELRAHQTFMRLHVGQGLDAARDGSPRLLVRQGDLLLRGIGYVGENLVDGLFREHGEQPEELLAAARAQTELPIASIHSSYMPDVFETALGRAYRAQMTVDLCDDDTALTFTVPDGRQSITYTADKFQVTISRIGGMAFEVGCSVEGTSVSHVRILESMIGPHTGRFSIDWDGAPSALEDDIDLLAARRMLTFVDSYLRGRDWVARLRRIAPGPEIEQMDAALARWHDALARLVPHLPQQGAAGSEGERGVDPQLRECYRDLRACREQTSGLAHAWIARHPEPALAAEVLEGRDIFPAGLRFGRMMDVASIIFDRLRKFLAQRYGGSVLEAERRAGGEYQDIRYVSDFDPNTGWQTIFSCNQLVLKLPGGEEVEPRTPDEFQRIQELPEFRGFQVQSRESRAAIDDWAFVSPPEVRNLALIRSHATDAMHVGENRTFLWFPDDPQFVLTIYIESARLIGDIRVLVLTFNANAKRQIRATEGLLDLLKSGQRLQRTVAEQFDVGRSDIAIFRTHADKILDLLRACTISKYEDHGKLLGQMLIENKAGNAQDALEHNLTTLDEFYSYITTLLQRRIEARAQSGQTLIAGMLFILASVSALSAIPTLQPFLDTTLSGIMPTSTVTAILQGVLGAILLGSIGIAIFALWRRGRRV